MNDDATKERRALIVFLVACYGVALIAGLMTRPEIPGWYASLAKPAWRPPNWLFGPVWTVLYGMMAVAGWRVWRAPHSPARTIALGIFWAQLALNFLWSPVFFNLHRIGLALLIIGGLWVALEAFVGMSWKLDRVAAALFIPYVVWVGFAGALNYTIWRMNDQNVNLKSLPTVYASRLSGALDGEGFPSAAVWQVARPVVFDQDWRGVEKDEQRTTEVRLLWTPENLFIRFAAGYRTITVFADSRSDGWRYQLWEKDVAETFLQPESGDAFEYQELEVAPNGYWIDLHISHGKNNELKSGLKRRASIDAEKKVWTAELAIPMRGLTEKFDAARPWRVNFFRVEGGAEPRFYSAWSPTKTEKPNFHVPGAFGYLLFEK